MKVILIVGAILLVAAPALAQGDGLAPFAQYGQNTPGGRADMGAHANTFRWP